MPRIARSVLLSHLVTRFQTPPQPITLSFLIHLAQTLIGLAVCSIVLLNLQEYDDLRRVGSLARSMISVAERGN